MTDGARKVRMFRRRQKAALATVGWLARHWQTAGLPIRVALVAVTLVTMMLTAAGADSFLVQGHLDHFTCEQATLDAAIAPITKRIELASFSKAASARLTPSCKRRRREVTARPRRRY